MNESSAEGGRAGKVPILLLKTKSTPHDGYEEYFSVNGKGEKWSYEPTFVPVLEHRLQEEALGTVRDLLKKKKISKNAGARYGGLIFTSQRAVEAFARVVEQGMFITRPLCRESSFIDISTQGRMIQSQLRTGGLTFKTFQSTLSALLHLAP